MLSDDFIETVITPQTKQTDEVSQMVYREFHGMEAVAQFDNQTSEYTNGGEN